MPEPEEGKSLAEHIEENAAGAQQVTVDGVTTRMHSLREQIEADDHLAERKASKSRKLPIRLAKIRPGGSI